MSDPAISQFFTWGSLGTLAGATSATFVVTNTLQSALNWSPRWSGLIVAQVTCLGTAVVSGQGWDEYVIAILNGCLVYLSAAGATAAGANLAHGPAPMASTRSWRSPNMTERGRPDFLSPWF